MIKKWAFFYNHLGLSLEKLDYHHDAFDYYEEALRIELDSSEISLESMYNNLSNIQRTWSHGLKKSFEYTEQLLIFQEQCLAKFGENLSNEDLFLKGTLLHDIGYVYSKIPAKRDKSIDYYEVALDIFLKEKELCSIIQCYNSIGDYFFSIKEEQKGQEAFNQALEIIKNWRGEIDKSNVIKAMNFLGSSIYDHYKEKFLECSSYIVKLR